MEGVYVMRVEVIIEETARTSIWVNEAESTEDAINKVKNLYNTEGVIGNLPKVYSKTQFKVWGIEDDLHN